MKIPRSYALIIAISKYKNLRDDKQLRFPEKPVHVWGLNITRRTVRNNETDRIVNTMAGPELVAWAKTHDSADAP